MASTNKTKHIGLPQWEASHKPERSDFNTAFAAVDSALGDKVSKTPNPKWHTLTLKSGWQASGTPQYMKDDNGWVIVSGTMKKDTAPQRNEIFAELPEGFRPIKNTVFVLSQVMGTESTSWSTYAWAKADGNIHFVDASLPSNYLKTSAVGFSIVYKAS